MNKKGYRATRVTVGLIIAILVTAVIVAVFLSYLTSNKMSNMSNGVPFDENTFVVFQSPNCSCCGNYRDYLKEQGFQVEAIYAEDMASIKKKYQVPQDMYSCHTTVIGDYFVEGHVPIEAIEKLLAEKPDIDGIALPDMPSGTPGMSGKQTGAFKIYALSDSIPSEFMIISE